MQYEDNIQGSLLKLFLPKTILGILFMEHEGPALDHGYTETTCYSSFSYTMMAKPIRALEFIIQ